MSHRPVEMTNSWCVLEFYLIIREVNAVKLVTTCTQVFDKGYFVSCKGKKKRWDLGVLKKE